jgi:hypothetical protein
VNFFNLLFGQWADWGISVSQRAKRDLRQPCARRPLGATLAAYLVSRLAVHVRVQKSLVSVDPTLSRRICKMPVAKTEITEDLPGLPESNK